MEQKLKELLNNAYAPYSKVQVAAILVAKDGTTFEGVNVENAAYPSGICAERTAMFAAIAAGKKPGDFKEIHLTASTKGVLWPCSGCRQVMTELLDPETNVIVWNNGQKHIATVEELVPHSVKKGDLT